MAKGFNSRGMRGMGGMGGGMNMNMLRQAQKMQEQMEQITTELEAKEYTAAAGGGAAETVRRTVCPAGRKPGCCRDRKSAAADFADGWAGRICVGLRARKSGLRGLAQAGTDFL